MAPITGGGGGFLVLPPRGALILRNGTLIVQRDGTQIVNTRP